MVSRCMVAHYWVSMAHNLPDTKCLQAKNSLRCIYIDYLMIRWVNQASVILRWWFMTVWYSCKVIWPWVYDPWVCDPWVCDNGMDDIWLYDTQGVWPRVYDPCVCDPGVYDTGMDDIWKSNTQWCVTHEYMIPGYVTKGCMIHVRVIQWCMVQHMWYDVRSRSM